MISMTSYVSDLLKLITLHLIAFSSIATHQEATASIYCCRIIAVKIFAVSTLTDPFMVKLERID